MQPKSIFKSKSGIASMLIGISGVLGTYSDDVAKFLADNASLINISIGLIGFILRKVTHGKVVLWDSSDNTK
jgi:hypothetical protein